MHHLERLQFISGLSSDPDGKWLGFHVHTPNLKENNYESDFWVLNLENNKQTQMTTSGKVGAYQWRVLGDSVIYTSQKDPEVKAAIENGIPLTVFYELPIIGGESREFMRLNLPVSSFKEIEEDIFLVLGHYDASISKYEELDEAGRKEFIETQKEAKDYAVLEEIPFWSNGGTYTSGKRNRLYVYNRKTESLTPISDAKESVSFYEWDSKRKQVLYISKTYTDKMPLLSSLWVYDFEAQRSKNLLEETHSLSGAYFLSDDAIVFIGNDQKTYGLNQNPDFFKLSLKTGAVEKFAGQFDKSIGNSVGSDARYGSRRSIKSVEGDLYFITTEDDSAYLNKLNANGKIERLVKEKGSVDDFEYTGSRLFVTALRDNSPQEIYEVETETQAERRCTAFNAWFRESASLATPEEITFKNEMDQVIKGWVMKPVDYDPEKKYPAILNIHGGPKTVYGPVFYHEMQVWANQGYFVFFCNPRGSDGKGNAFADIRGKYGTIDYDDIMQFTDVVLIKNKAIDIENVFVTGGSYGGFMTNWIIGHTDRFKAAASQRSISNWTTEYGVTDIGYYFVPDQIAADLWTNYEKLWDHSPLKYADHVTTPTLFIHSDMDYRCWLPEALQMFTALKQFGVPSRLCVFKGENHELSRGGKPKHRIKRLEEICTWFELHMD